MKDHTNVSDTTPYPAMLNLAQACPRSAHVITYIMGRMGQGEVKETLILSDLAQTFTDIVMKIIVALSLLYLVICFPCDVC